MRARLALPSAHYPNSRCLNYCVATGRKRRYIVAVNPTIANLNLIRDAQHIVPETSDPRRTRLLARIEKALRKAFGDDEQTIANSLRGF
jgi:hypothetical protein